MTPTIFRDENNDLYCSVGSKGSQKIPQGISFFIIYTALFGKSKDVMSQPRVYFYNGEFQYDNKFSKGT